MRVYYVGSGKEIVSDSGFLSSLDQQSCNAHKYHKSKAERIFKDRPVNTIWESLSFPAQNMTTLLLFLCSEYTTRQPAVVRRVPRASHAVLVLSGGNRWSAAGYNLLLQPDSFKEDKFKENAEGDIPAVPWSLTQGTT